MSANESRCVLIVDDDEDIRQFLRVALEEEGYQVLEAGDGQETLKQVRQSSPHLVLLDIMLPDMNGFAVLEHIRQQFLVRPRILFMTAFTGMEERVMRAHVDGFLLKPFVHIDFVLREVARLVKYPPLA